MTDEEVVKASFNAGAFDVRLMSHTPDSTLRAIAELSVRAWGRQPAPGEIEKRTAALREELLTINPDRKAVFLALMRGGIIGFVKTDTSEANPSEWWLIGLVVSLHQRRRGIASALTAACAAYARERGATKLRSETHSDNEASIRFHEAFGFACTGAFVAADGDQKVGFLLDLPRLQERR